MVTRTSPASPAPRSSARTPGHASRTTHATSRAGRNMGRECSEIIGNSVADVPNEVLFRLLSIMHSDRLGQAHYELPVPGAGDRVLDVVRLGRLGARAGLGRVEHPGGEWI